MFVNEKLADSTIPRPYVLEKLLEALYAISGQASCAVFASVTYAFAEDRRIKLFSCVIGVSIFRPGRRRYRLGWWR